MALICWAALFYSTIAYGCALFYGLVLALILTRKELS